MSTGTPRLGRMLAHVPADDFALAEVAERGRRPPVTETSRGAGAGFDLPHRSSVGAQTRRPFHFEEEYDVGY
jgi:hypothetical protein